MQHLNPQDFRACVGLFATGVTIVTARAEDGTPVGLTANSFNSASMTPPLALWSLGLQAGSMPASAPARTDAIHILAAEQRELAERFATRGIDRFADLAWSAGAGGAPSSTARRRCWNAVPQPSRARRTM